ncbi:MAG: hypothetical protein GXP36_02815 [Actinobacteria bacterium]|nr:hypothetical protein [Actinomycetota bacterium]
MNIRHAAPWRFPALAVVAILVVGACSTEPSAEQLPETTSEELVMAAINTFATEFPQFAGDARVVRVPPNVDVVAVERGLDPPRKVTSAALRDSRTRIDVAVYWEVDGVSQESDYWRVGITSVNGSDYVSVTMFFRVNDAGEIERFDPSGAGVTPTTSVS